MQKCR